MGPFSNVYPTLVECFGIVLIGYLCGRINILSENQAHGIQIYISRVALPAIIFKSMVELDFSKVNWAFWFGILTAKAALFLLVLLLTLYVSKPVSENLGKAGLFAIFVTQSNDLALGLPLFDAIFKSTHPEYLQYIYLLIPVSIALLNPVGLLLLELNKNSSDKENNTGKYKLLLKTFKGIITNPLVFMVIIGVIINQIFTACKVDKTNWFLTAFLKVLAESFGATALFYLGFSLVGNMKNYRGFDLVVPFLLVACKSLILPMMARQTVSWFKSGNTTDEMHPGSNDHVAECLPSFAFIYGTLPTAPTVVVFATMYNVQVETIGTSMVLGTLLSAPIMFVSSKMISMMQSAKPEVDKAFEKATFDIGILSAVCCVWVFVVFFSTKLHRRPLHKFTMCLIFNQLVFSVASSISDAYSTKVVFAFFVFGLLGSYCWTALLSYALFIVRCRGEKYLFKIRWFILSVGMILPLCLCLSLTLTRSGTASLSSHEKNSFLLYMDQNKYFNWILVVVLICCVITTIVCLIVLQRCDKYCRCKKAAKRTEEKENLIPDEESAAANRKEMCRQCKTLCQRQFDIEDLPKTPCCHEGQLPCCTRDPCNPLLTSTNSDKEVGTLKDVTSSSISYGSVSPISQVSQETFDGLKDIEEMTLDEYFQGDRHQLSRHIILILFLSFFSILNVFLCLERIFGRAKNRKTGIFIEIEFLVVICTLGQGFVSFSVFGFNKMFFNFISFERLGLLQPFCLAKKIRLKPVSALDAATTNLCLRFKIHHLERCQRDLVQDLRFHFRTYKEVFRGDQMVDWLIEFGLANTRMDAVHYGNCLLRGRIMEHCVKEHYFYDLPYFYRFCSENEIS